ncbi:L-threonine aldolase [Stella humosa]|uniref:L-threonine aldolase n=1 Tax=Stella humosa TaxID=94 RepID=A0A3N1KYW5_9PROT|nr:GntG family PLP-dependent aldolase [Stella humosa]ROP84357.1 L-threonine aldolase [Stella humosa]BBK33872.1 threonine aldolase [Stella humosa]
MTNVQTLPRVAVDLGSDTSTRPTKAMLAAMMAAETGDEQLGEDPTTTALNERVADLLGKEAAVFMPSGTICNQIAMLVHTRPGDEVICGAGAHVYGSEGAGIAVMGGALIRPIACDRDIFDADQLTAAVRRPKMRAPRSRLVVLEQTANRGGGAVWPLAAIQSVAARAREHGLAVHMDGARLMNACVAAGVSAKDFAAPFDTAWIDLSKGLGCPVGAVLAGPRDFIEAAWVWKHRLGGALRQSGILAAAGLHALDHHVERLAVDHENARIFASLAAAIPGVRLDPQTVETNIVFLDLSATGIDTAILYRRLREQGVRIMVEGPTRMRAVTHLDVTRADVERAAAMLAQSVEAGPT